MKDDEGKRDKIKEKTVVKRWEEWFENHYVFAPLLIIRNILAGLLGLTATIAGLYGLFGWSGHPGQKDAQNVLPTPSHSEINKSDTTQSLDEYNQIFWNRIAGKFDK